MCRSRGGCAQVSRNGRTLVLRPGEGTAEPPALQGPCGWNYENPQRPRRGSALTPSLAGRALRGEFSLVHAPR